ncbi:MAG: hypothetical protein ABR562_04175 [Thermoplasmatota archaeon]|nr:hypothetical protein [Halobacteriales archaeon]
MRLFPQENPLCQRMSCDHPLKGARREGHFDMGMGPCKAPGCQCPSFQYTDPSLLLELRSQHPPRRQFQGEGDAIPHGA